MNRGRAVFFDRDGTLVEEVDFLSRPEDLRLLPGAAEAVRRVNRSEVPAIVVTNQSGVARGFFSEATLQEIHRTLENVLEAEGAVLDGIYYCPHHPKGTITRYKVGCDCRKPAPGLFKKAAAELGLEPRGSVVIGDSSRDLEAGKEVECFGVLVRSGYGEKALAALSAEAERQNASPDFVASDILQAVDWALEQILSEQGT